jgi:hypothetical protein
MANGNIYRDTIQSEAPRPTLAEVEQARPHSGKGPPSRCASHKSSILELLRKRGPEGLLGSELYARPELYGRSPRNRISELRKAGCLISGKAHGSSDWHYVLLRDSDGTKSFSNSSDWYERQEGRPRPGAQPAQDDCFVLTPPESD